MSKLLISRPEVYIRYERCSRSLSHGRGRVIMRARAEIETGSTHDKIVVTEIPYGVNKAELIKNIADLANEKKIEVLPMLMTNPTVKVCVSSSM